MSLEILSKFTSWIKEKIQNSRDDASAACNDYLKALGFVSIAHAWIKVLEVSFQDYEQNKEFYQHTKSVKLPSVIVNQKDIFSFFLDDNEANFITLKKVKSTIITEEKLLTNNLTNKVVCIKSADPGYDYLFSKNIGGLITCYGGANSHMAIRCAEMGIPAVIGCGENNFERYCKAKNIEIDASNKQVKILS